MDLRDSVVLITGAAKRIGRAIALELAGHGAHIALHYHRSRTAAERTAREVAALGAKVYLVQADQCKPAEIRRAVAKVIKHFGRIDILINNASIFERTPFEQVTPRHWQRFMATNVQGPFFFAQAVAPMMQRRRRGKIINLCDVAAMKPYPGYLPYSASKAALVNLTLGLARHLAPHIQVNAICPGAVLWPNDPAPGAAKFVRAIRKKTLLGRLGTPENIAAAVRYLIEGGDYVTGTVLTVDGGQLVT